MRLGKGHGVRRQESSLEGGIRFQKKWIQKIPIFFILRKKKSWILFRTTITRKKWCKKCSKTRVFRFFRVSIFRSVRYLFIFGWKCLCGLNPGETMRFLVRYSMILGIFLNRGQPQPLFCLFSVFSNKQYNFYNKSMWKNVQMSIQYTGPVFKPTTFWTWVITHNH